ncbi:hypothetical protein RIF24_09250 [Exiguobacterium acetylicum]|uniref:hypothetical protein n=1 Tax=Exiguobacterium acetylicum TaxID=41170 RepID=UPI0039779BA6
MSQLFSIAFVVYILSLNIAAIYLIHKRIVPAIIAGLTILFLIPTVSWTIMVFFVFVLLVTPVMDWFDGLESLINLMWFGLLNGCCYIVFGTLRWMISIVRK